MTRKAWLESQWNRYPAALAGWTDVSEFLNSEAASRRSPEDANVVAGRLSQSSGKFEIESGGARAEFSLADSLSWLEGAGVLPTAAPPELDFFSSGDLIVVKLLGESSRLIASEILLLAPSSGVDEENLSFDVERSRNWDVYLQSIREFFKLRQFTEVQTPTLVPSPGTEPFLDPFATEWEVGSTTKTLYLPTSPEFHLKQLLARGWSRIFELKTCFRNGEIGAHHQPEFLMLEWYRAYANLEKVADDVDELLQDLSARFARPVPRLKRVTIAELFVRHYDGFSLTPETRVEELRELASQNEIDVADDDSFDDVFYRLFLERIEPTLGNRGPLLVSHYPPSQAALSRIGVHGFAERFEIYWHGLELANAFHELNDPLENERRFALDAEKKLELAKPAVPRDENLVRALKKGMPPSGGIALGVDRLFMALFGLDTIEQTRAFPAARP